MTGEEQNNSLNIGPIISVYVTARHHAPYIKQCLDGIIIQETTFPFEIIIDVEESTDGTREICIEYANKYPDIIQLFLHSGKEVKHINGNATDLFYFTEIFKAARGKYVALCGGNGFWTDPLKLQKQVDFLEANRDFAICHHNVKIQYDDNRESLQFSNLPKQKEVSAISDLAKGNFINTSSCVYRNNLINEFPEWFYKCPYNDYPLLMLNARFGKIKYIAEVMGGHNEGVLDNKAKLYNSEKLSEVLELMKNYFTDEINKELLNQQNKVYKDLLTGYQNNSELCNYYSKKIIENDSFYIFNLNSENAKLRANQNELAKNVKNTLTFKLGKFILFPIIKLKDAKISLNKKIKRGKFMLRIKLIRIKFILLFKKLTPGNNILIFSDPRGGSTWLMEMVMNIPQTAVIWEPFHPDLGVIPSSFNFGDQAYVPENIQREDIKKLFIQLFSGKFQNNWTTRMSTVKDFFKAKKFIIKFVRLNSILPWLTKNFKFNHKPIYLLRHPVAVVLSQIKAFYSKEQFDKFEIPVVMYNEKYVEHKEFLSTLKTRFEKYFALWCLHNVTTINHPRSGKDWMVVYYENLITNPEKELNRIFSELKIDMPLNILDKVRQPSELVFKNDFITESQGQLNKWKDRVYENELQDGERILQYFNIDIYSCYQNMPLKD